MPPSGKASMQINYTADAFASLTQLINFIEAKNTSGAGLRWLSNYEKYLQKHLANAKRKRPCNNATFKKLNLRCVYYNDWVIAFSIHENYILIETLLHKSRIKD
jgi:hypothetical protein